ncbi:hypothetical protein [Granulicella sp. dw_53]|uniref:hypothetical protein n=1 Tax=Granulicella sp. dw_53 TaxID=2719792 RepID=UPI001BD51532|nr:hypothetical protein [Granulicella sp. dw_53]
MLPGGGSGSSGCSFGQAHSYDVAGGTVSEEQVLHDLLNTPLAEMRGGAKLRLLGVEAAEGGG